MFTEEETVSAERLLQTVVGDVTACADERRIAVVAFALTQELMADHELARVREALGILVHDAVSATSRGGFVQVTARRSSDALVFEIVHLPASSVARADGERNHQRARALLGHRDSRVRIAMDGGGSVRVVVALIRPRLHPGARGSQPDDPQPGLP